MRRSLGLQLQEKVKDIANGGYLSQAGGVEVELLAELVLDTEGELGEVERPEADLAQVCAVVVRQYLALILHHLLHQVANLGAS